MSPQRDACKRGVFQRNQVKSYFLLDAQICVMVAVMARPLRITYEGAVHHVTMRGNDRRNIFLTNWDREHFLTKLAESVRLYDIRLYLFCQMTNHWLC
jgi:hypothetical protein